MKLHYLSASRKIEPNNSFMYILVALVVFCSMPPGVR